MTVTLGYATASNDEHGLDSQLAALADAGVDSRRIFTDKFCGPAEKVRAGLLAMLSYARSGDTVVVVALDRLGRSVSEVTQTVTDLIERGITLRALNDGLDTATATGRHIAAILSSLAELDLEAARQRR